MRNFLIKTHRIMEQFGINPRQTAKALQGVIGYIASFKKYYRMADKDIPIKLYPCLIDRYEEGGTTKNEYFWQDLYVARRIFDLNPKIHVDIGSRIDGFVAHIASFRQLEVFDIRPITALIPGVTFHNLDVMSLPDIWHQYCDSLSCLHALEHFGLGRYGDPVNPFGHAHGLRNLSLLLKPGGRLFLSVPIGSERVEFNAHRVFSPYTIVELAKTNDLELDNFISYTALTGLSAQADIYAHMNEVKNLQYSLGIFEFHKK